MCLRKLLSLTSLAVISLFAFNSHGAVNVLSWWGYLNQSDIKNHLQKTCNTQVSVDEYYSNDEFLRRWKEHKNLYGAVIYSNTVSKLVENEIARKNIDLTGVTAGYLPVIQKKYQQRNYPKNIVFFVHSLTGFLWNEKNLKLSKNDSIADIVEKSKDKLVIIVDDPIEANNFLKPPVSLGQSLRTMAKSAKVIISNELDHLVTDDKFAFSYMWSGQSHELLGSSKNKSLKFLVHPNLSHVSSDLVAQLKSDPATSCVAKELGSERLLAMIEQKTKYASSFNLKVDATAKSVRDKITANNWLEGPNKNVFNSLNRAWKKVKMELTKQ